MKRLLNLFLLLTMFVVNAAATNYDLYVGGVQVTSDNIGNIRALGDKGTAKYNPTRKILTIGNAEISMLRTNKFVESNINGLTIEFYGTNNIKVAQGDAFDLKRTTTITCNPTEADAHLNITASSTQSIFALGSGNYVFKDIDITTAGGYFAKCATSTNVANLTFDNATVNHDATLQGTTRMLTAFTNISGIEFKNFCEITWPAITKYSSEQKTMLFVSDNTESPVRNFEIGKICSGITLNGAHIPVNYASDVYGDGKVKFDATTSTLTFSGANITANEGFSIVESTIRGLKIIFEHSNTFQGARNAHVFNLTNETSLEGRVSDVNISAKGENSAIFCLNGGTFGGKFTFKNIRINSTSSDGSMFMLGWIMGPKVIFNQCKVTHTCTDSGAQAFVNVNDLTTEGCTFLKPTFFTKSGGTLMDTKTGMSAKDFQIGDVDITISGNKVDIAHTQFAISGEGNADIVFSYDSKTIKILKTNTKCKANYPVVKCNTDGINIEFTEGDCTIENNNCNLFELNCDAVLRSRSNYAQNFKVNGLGWRFIRSGGDIEIREMNITSENGAFAYSNDDTKNFTIDNSQIAHTSSNATYSIQNYSNLVLGKKLYFSLPLEAEYKDKSLYDMRTGMKAIDFTISKDDLDIEIYVADQKIRSRNTTDVLGDGKVKYDVTKNELTFENIDYHIDVKDNLVNSTVGGLTIKFKGTNRVQADNNIFNLLGENTITSEGGVSVLDCESRLFGCWPNCSITFDKANIISHNNQFAVGCRGGFNFISSNVIDVSIYDPGIEGTYTNCEKIDLDDDVKKYSFVVSKGKNAKPVIVNGVIICDENKDDILGDGKIKYDANTSQLIFNNTDITTKKGCPVVESLYEDLGIVLNGTNTFNVNGADCFVLGYWATNFDPGIRSYNNDGKTYINTDKEHAVISSVSGRCFDGVNIESHGGLFAKEYSYAGLYDLNLSMYIVNSTIKHTSNLPEDESSIQRYIDLEGCSFDNIGNDYKAEKGSNGIIQYYTLDNRPIRDFLIKKNDASTAITNANANESDAPAYDLMGRKVNSNYRGIVIKNGKKVVMK